MVKKTVVVKFPSREEEMFQAIDAWAKEGVKMLLCHGVSLDSRKQKYICDCGDKNCKSAGKHPISGIFPKGEYSATNDTKSLKKAFSKNHNANLAAVIDGFFVIDVDGVKGAEYVGPLGLPRTLCVRTGRKYGRHHYFRGTLVVKTKRIDQLDVKTKGYVMLPPSRHISGKIYRRVS